MKKLWTQLLIKIESRLPEEWGLVVSHQEHFLIFSGRLSKTVHLTCLKEYDQPDIILPKSSEPVIIDFPLKYNNDPVDELTAYRNRLRIDLALQEMEQEREFKERQKQALLGNYPDEPTLKIA